MAAGHAAGQLDERILGGQHLRRRINRPVAGLRQRNDLLAGGKSLGSVDGLLGGGERANHRVGGGFDQGEPRKRRVMLGQRCGNGGNPLLLFTAALFRLERRRAPGMPGGRDNIIRAKTLAERGLTASSGSGPRCSIRAWHCGC